MRRYGKWVLTLGILAVAPGLAAAASFPWQSDDTETASSAAAQKSKNQQIAEKIALALKKSAFHGYEIDIEYRNGLATLRGKVSDPRQKVRASQVVAAVSGVHHVENQLIVLSASQGPIRQVNANGADLAAGPPQNQAQGQPTQMSANQEKAMQIGRALQDAGLNGYDIEIMYQNGRCVLQGVVGTPEQRAGAAQIANSVPGVQSVANQLRLQGQAGPSAAQNSPNYTMAAYQTPGMPGGPPAPVTNGGPGPIGPPGMPQVPGSDQPMPGGMPPMGAPIPATGPGPQSSGPAYDNPNLPQYGWPSYAQYPNYAGVTYPSQYSASAWPYIGPFYPYPQVPLNWRKVTLEWSDGHWDLNFDSRTDRWWWFLNPKNW